MTTGAVSINGGCQVRNSQGPIVVQNNGYLNTFSVITGANNTGFGIDVSGGIFGYFSSAKPTITGTSGDTRVGGVTKAYAAIPFVNWDATAPTAFTGNGAAIIVN